MGLIASALFKINPRPRKLSYFCSANLEISQSKQNFLEVNRNRSKQKSILASGEARQETQLKYDSSTVNTQLVYSVSVCGQGSRSPSQPVNSLVSIAGQSRASQNYDTVVVYKSIVRAKAKSLLVILYMTQMMSHMVCNFISVGKSIQC